MLNFPFSGIFYNKYQQYFEFERKDYHFKVGIEHGKLLFDRRLITCKGTHLPIDLYLKYNQGHFNQSNNLYNLTNLPKGFKFNYHVFVYQANANSSFYYEDKDGLVHEFVKAVHFQSLYYDKSGTGLMLEATNNNGYVIHDDDGNYQLFDTYGRLQSIHEKIASSQESVITISYTNNNSLLISSISDNYGHTLTFSYYQDQVQIFFNNTRIFILNMSLYDESLTNIWRYTSSSTYDTDSFDWDSDGLDALDLASGESIFVDYNSNKVSCFSTNYKQHYYEFSYDETNKKTTITNARNLSTIYSYGQEQLARQINNDSSLYNHISLSKDVSSYLLKKPSLGNPIIKLDLALPNGQTAYTLAINNSSFYRQTENTSGTTLYSKRNYVFCAQISGGLTNGSITIQLFDSGIGLISTLKFKGEATVLAHPIGLKNISNRSLYLKIWATNANSITISNVNICPLLGDYEVLCSNIDTGDGVFYYYNTPYFFLPTHNDMTFFDSNNQVIHYSYTYFLTENDYLANEKAFYKRSGNSFKFWCNDKTVLVDAVYKVVVETGTEYYLEYSIDFNHIVFNDLGSYEIAKFYKLTGSENNSFAVNEISHDSSSFTSPPTNTYSQEKEIRYVCNHQTTTYYYYDEQRRLLKTNRGDGVITQNIFNNRGNITYESVSKANQNYSIVKTYSYYADNVSRDNLEYETSLVGSSLFSKQYYYNGDNNVSCLALSGYFDVKYYYENPTNENLVSVKFDDDDDPITQTRAFETNDVSELATSNNTYSFDYFRGELSEISYNNNTIVTFAYYARSYNGHAVYDNRYTYYANGDHLEKGYDEFGRLNYYDSLSYFYDELSNVIEIYDDSDSYSLHFTYDYYGNLTHVYNDDTGLSIHFYYDKYKRNNLEDYEINNNIIFSTYYFFYDKSGLEKTVKVSAIDSSIDYFYIEDDVDDFSRLASRKSVFESNDGFAQYYEYCHNVNQTNHMISEVTYRDLVNLVPSSAYKKDIYSYDSLGNITSIIRSTSDSQNTSSVTYSYDFFGRLIRENNPYYNRTYVYNYDKKGNIISKTEYVYTTGSLSNPLTTHSYSYSNQSCPDHLSSFDNQLCQYDEIGNPTKYRGHDMTWASGTLPISYEKDNTTTFYFEYDGFRNRVVKYCNSSLVVSYEYLNGKLIREHRTNNNVTKIIAYLYGHTGVIGFLYNGVAYYYEKNIQQDVIAIRTTNNAIVARYIYDAWGNHKVLNPDGTENTSATFIGNINPNRYRSYYYDTDLEMYWLTTRYYDPQTGRFISPDDWSYLDFNKLHGLNLYAYSKNNPVMYCDPSGHRAFLIALFATVAATAVAAVVLGLTAGALTTLFGYQIYKDMTKKSSKNVKPNDDNFLDETPYGGDGFTVYYDIRNKEGMSKDYELIVYESWRFNEKQIKAFLKWLKEQPGNESLNVQRVYNEWMWHNIAFALDIKVESSRTINAYFDAPDKNYGWFFDLFHIWW